MVNNDLQLQLVMPSSASLILISRWSESAVSKKIEKGHKLHAQLRNAFTSGQFGIEWKDDSIFDNI